MKSLASEKQIVWGRGKRISGLDVLGGREFNLFFWYQLENSASNT